MMNNSNLNNKKEIWLDPDRTNFLNCKLVFLPNRNATSSRIEEGCDDKTIKLQSATTVGRLYGNWYHVYAEMTPKEIKLHQQNEDNNNTNNNLQILSKIEESLIAQFKELTVGHLLSWYNQTSLAHILDKISSSSPSSSSSSSSSSLSTPIYVSQCYRLRIWAKSANFCFPSGHPNDTFDLLDANEINL